MSDILTRPSDFRSAPVLPSIRSTRPQLDGEFAVNIRGILAEAAFGGFVGINPVSTSPVSKHPAPTAAPMRQGSLATLAERSVRARPRLVDEFGKALIEAIELSKTMVAEDEAAPINDQTYFYTVEVLAPLIIAMELAVPLMLPLQNGGIGAEWHDHGMNIELRFRSPYHIYVVLEDARGAIQPFYGRDPRLVQAREALREFATTEMRTGTSVSSTLWRARVQSCRIPEHSQNLISACLSLSPPA